MLDPMIMMQRCKASIQVGVDVSLSGMMHDDNNRHNEL